MSKVKTQTNDPDNYNKLSIPFESVDLANEALSNFHKELSDLRKKHKIPDVLVVTKGSVRHADGEIGDFMQHSSYGSSLNQLPMAAYAYGQTKADHDVIISKLIAGKAE